MAVKHGILTMLEEQREAWLSGQELANRLSVSRTAVWKGIKTLQEEGHHIEALRNKGYRLVKDSDVLSAEGIRHFLKAAEISPQILVYDTVDSTNTALKQLALEGAEAGTVLLANQQTAGRGRLGRSFYSPKDTGLYLSFLFRPHLGMEASLKVTIGAGVAVCRAIETFSAEKAEIKWVNDIFIHGRKVCGILTEAVADFESGQVDNIVIGIGINIKTREFPGELQQIAGSVFPTCPSRNELAAAVMKEVYRILPALEKPALIAEYKKRSCLLGKEIVYVEKEREVNAKAVDINAKGNLIVEKDGGEIIPLQWGEVRVRGL